MSDYKHGNWFCKPANEAEAKEIIERAVASGARRGEVVGRSYAYGYEWDLFDAWGVYSGLTYTGDGAFTLATEYTMQQVRELFPLPGEQVAGWDGEGLPPVGSWVISPGGAKAFYVGLNSFGGHVFELENCGLISYNSLSGFRPLRSEREEWVEDALSILQKDPSAMPKQLMSMIYDALKSGDLKTPE